MKKLLNLFVFLFNLLKYFGHLENQRHAKVYSRYDFSKGTNHLENQRHAKVYSRYDFSKDTNYF